MFKKGLNVDKVRSHKHFFQSFGTLNEIPNSQNGNPFESIETHFFAFSHTYKIVFDTFPLHFPCHASTLVVSSRLRSQHHGYLIDWKYI
jgi:hypothetical protein